MLPLLLKALTLSLSFCRTVSVKHQLKEGFLFGNVDGYRPHDPSLPTALYIPIIRGELGDSLRQLSWALFYAEQNNFTTVEVTQQAWTKHFKDFITIPEDETRKDHWGYLRPIRVEPLPEGHRTCSVGTTEFDPRDSRSAFNCGGIQPKEWRRLLKKYVKPLLVETARTDRRSANPDSELVVHMRSGDAMTTTSPLAKLEVELPPCAFYDKIIEEGIHGAPFQSIRIITQADASNPCVRAIIDRHPGRSVVVQRGSREEDAAALMNARHLVLAPSYFSFLMAQMNEQVQTIFYAQSNQIHSTYPDGIMPCGSLGDPKVFAMSVPGIEATRSTMSERIRWMMGYKPDLISTASICDQDQLQALQTNQK